MPTAEILCRRSKYLIRPLTLSRTALPKTSLTSAKYLWLLRLPRRRTLKAALIPNPFNRPLKLKPNTLGRAAKHKKKRPFALLSFLRSIFAKILPCIPCLRADLYDDDDNASTLSFDPIVALSMFSRPSADSKPVIVVSNNLESVERINDPWEFFRELEALKTYVNQLLPSDAYHGPDFRVELKQNITNASTRKSRMI